MSEFKRLFRVLTANEPKTGRQGRFWWASAKIDDEFVTVKGFHTQTLALEALLAEVSASVR